MCQKKTAPSYKKYSCSSNHTCSSQTVSCSDQYQCVSVGNGLCCTSTDCGISGSCKYGPWQNVACGGSAATSGGIISCSQYQMLQERISSNSSYTIYGCANNICSSQTFSCDIFQFQCVDDSTCVPSSCTCTSWTNGACGTGGCSATQRLQTRTCTPSGCSTETQCVSDSTCTSPPPPSCTCTSWINGACGAGGCSATQRLQTRTCTPSGCSTETQCVSDSTCTSPPPPPSPNIVIQFTNLTAAIGETVTTTITVDFSGSIYGIVDNSLVIKMNDMTTTGWQTTFSGYIACPQQTLQKTTVSKAFKFPVPGNYKFSVQGQIFPCLFPAQRSSFSTTSQPLLIKAKYGQTTDGDPTDVSIDKDVYLGTTGQETAVESGVVLGSENGNVIVRGNLNLAANANPNSPIRIIYGKELSISSGAQIILPDQSKKGSVYFIKKGRPDPYANNTIASVCNSNYDSTRLFKYCGLNKICQNGQCVDYTPSF